MLYNLNSFYVENFTFLTLLFPVIFTYGQSIPATKSSIVSVRVKEYNKLIKNAKLKHLKKNI
jgi:hypothetical protein